MWSVRVRVSRHRHRHTTCCFFCQVRSFTLSVLHTRLQSALSIQAFGRSYARPRAHQPAACPHSETKMPSCRHHLYRKPGGLSSQDLHNCGDTIGVQLRSGLFSRGLPGQRATRGTAAAAAAPGGGGGTWTKPRQKRERRARTQREWGRLAAATGGGGGGR